MSKQQAQNQQLDTPSSVVCDEFVGLSLKADYTNRPKNSWWVLNDFDLYIPGSIRKTPGYVIYSQGWGPDIDALNCLEYLAQANNPQGGIRRFIGIGQDGNLYDLAFTSGEGIYTPIPALAALAPLFSAVPVMLEYPGYYIPFNIRSWVASTNYAVNDAVLGFGPDGNIYVIAVTAITGSGESGTVAPIWPLTGTVIDNDITWTNEGLPNAQRFFAYYLALVYPGIRPIRVVEWQYDPTNTGETPKYTVGFMGSPSATVPPELGLFQTTPNLNGYAPSAGRAYAWTYYNPNTLQESSPSFSVGQTKITETDNSNVSITVNGSILLPLPPTTTSTPYTSYQSYYAAIPVSVVNPSPGSGYTCVRFYATKDGGTEYFLVNTLFDGVGHQITNADGSIPVAQLLALSTANSWTDYFPIPGSQAAVSSCRVYEGSGVVNYAPDPENLGAEAWQFKKPATNPIYILPGGAPDGFNAFAYDGTGSAAGALYEISSAGILATPSTEYYFQVYMDNTNGNNDISVILQHPNGGNKTTLNQTAGAVGTVSSTYITASGQKRIQIVIELPTNVTVPIGDTILWADPVLELGSSISAVPTNYPTPDQSLIIPAPLPFQNNQPPAGRIAAIWNNALWIVDSTDPTKIWYSQQGSYELFPENNYVRPTTNIGTSVMELIPMLDRLMVTKERSIEQIFSYGSEPTPLDPQHGVLAYRSTVPYGAAAVSLMTNGLGRMSLVNVVSEGEAIDANFGTVLIGDDIKPIIDSISSSELYAQNLSNFQPCPSIYNNLDMYLLAYRTGVGVTYNRSMLARYMGRSSGFSQLTEINSIPVQVITIKEIQLPAGGTNGFAGAGTGQIYMVALTSIIAGTNSVVVLFQGGQQSFEAVAVSQPLPTPKDMPEGYWDYDKEFLYLYVEGQDIQNFTVQFMPILSTNLPLPDPTVATNFVPSIPLKFTQNKVRVGINSRLLAVRFNHNRQPAAGVTPMITRFILTYRIKGQTVSA